MNPNIVTSIKDEFKQFNPSFLFEWLSIISLHPNNQKYLMRLELLMAIFLSIKENEFTNKKQTRPDIITFFNDFNNKYCSYFTHIEDFIPLNQSKLTPIFIDGVKYYFFYGLLETPYSRQNVITNLINDIEPYSNKAIAFLKRSFFDSLRLQTKLLDRITKHDEYARNFADFYIPSTNFYNDIRLKMLVPDNMECTYCVLGCLDYSANKIIEHVFNYSLPDILESLILNIEGKNYLLLPHLHLEFFNNKIETTINNSKSFDYKWNELLKNFRKRLVRACYRFFHKSTITLSLSLDAGTDNLLDEYNFSNAHLIDSNKLLVFSVVEYKESKEYEGLVTIVKGRVKRLEEFKNRIVSSESISMLDIYNNVTHIQTCDVEVWHLLVYENISSAPYTINMDITSINYHIVEFGDLALVFDHLFSKAKFNASIDFLKFLENDNEFFSDSKGVISTNYLDRVAMYFGGHNYYLRNGKALDFITVAPNQGTDFESEYYYQKYKNNIHERIENRFPNKFNSIELVTQETYRAVDTLNDHILYIMNKGECPLLIFTTLHYLQLPSFDRELITILIPELFSFYLNRLYDDFLAMLNDNHINISDYSILVTSNIAQEQVDNRIGNLTSMTSEIGELPVAIETV